MDDASDVIVDPPSIVVPLEVVAPIVLGDCESAERQKIMYYQAWEVAALVYTCHATCVAKPHQSTFHYRSAYLLEHYSKFARKCFKMYGLKEGKGGTYHTVALSRIALSISRESKGNSLGILMLLPLL